jgi:hypothetical protein
VPTTSRPERKAGLARILAGMEGDAARGGLDPQIREEIVRRVVAVASPERIPSDLES